MKKFLSCLLAVLILASLTVTAFAAPSPETAVDVVKAVDADGNDVSAAISFVSWADRESLSDEDLAAFEEAYEALEDSDLSAVEALFGYATEEIAFPVVITLSFDGIEDISGMAHFADGEWADIEADVDEIEVTFSIDELGSFAVLSE